MHLFQTALAVANAWAYHDQEQQNFGQIPPGPDMPELIARVCKAKNEKSRATGFRPIRVLRDHWFEPQAPVLIHRADAETAIRLAREAIELEGDHPNTSLIERAIDWFMNQNPDPELCHPAALAAAGVTIAHDDRSRELWQQVIARQGIRVPNQGRKPATDTAMVMQDCITVANRSKDALVSARYLYYRLLRAVEGWHEDPAQRWVRLPFVYRSRVEESELWADSAVRFSVEVHFDGHQPEPQLQPDAEAPRSGCRRRKQGSESTAKRLTTGLKAERWFQDNHHTLPEFVGVDLEDRRDKCEGFDFEARLAEETKYIEVKALRAGKSTIRLTDLQWRVAQLEGERYFLVVVCDIDTDQPHAEVIRNPAVHLKPERRESRAPTVSWVIRMD